MIASAIFTGLLGIAASFLPAEILRLLTFLPDPLLTLLVQIIGALYVGFAIMNWMAKTVLIGGIYARPLAMGNFAHFMIGAITLVKAATTNAASVYFSVAAAIYSIFAVLFAIILFTSPTRKD